MSVVIDGVDLTRDLGLSVLIPSEDELAPDVQNYSVNIPGRHGEYSFKSWFQPRNFTIQLLIPPQYSRQDVQTKAREFLRLVYDSFGNPREVRVSFDFDPDKHFYVKVTSAIDIDRIVNSAKVNVDFTAYDPFSYSNIYSDEITWGSEDITFEYQYLLGHEGIGGTVSITSPTTLDNVYVDGYAIKPIFEISGSATALSFSTNGYSFSLPAFSNETWTIDFERYTVLRNGVSAFGDVVIGDFVLEPGNNVVVVGGNGISVDLRIKFRDKYI